MSTTRTVCREARFQKSHSPEQSGAAKKSRIKMKLRGSRIIIVDFIDMEREKNRDKVYHAFCSMRCQANRPVPEVFQNLDLGLIEISQ